MSRKPRFGLPSRIVLVIAALGLGGCSLVFIDGPPSAHAVMPAFSCDESKAWPVIDAVVAASSIPAMILAETRTDTVPFLFGYQTNTTHRGEEVLQGALGLALFGASAFIGNRRVNDCRGAYAELRQRLNTTAYRQPLSSGAR